MKHKVLTHLGDVSADGEVSIEIKLEFTVTRRWFF